MLKMFLLDFMEKRNKMMAILQEESSLMEIVKLIGADVLPDSQKATLEVAKTIRVGFLQQNAFSMRTIHMYRLKSRIR